MYDKGSKLAVLLGFDTTHQLYQDYSEKLQRVSSGVPTLPEYIVLLVHEIWPEILDVPDSVFVYEFVSNSVEVVPSFSLRALHVWAMCLVGQQLELNGGRAMRPSRLYGEPQFKAYMLSLMRNCLRPLRARKLLELLRLGAAARGYGRDDLLTRDYLACKLRNCLLFTEFPPCWNVVPYSLQDNPKEHYGGLLFYVPKRSIITRNRQDALREWGRGSKEYVTTLVMGPLGLDLFVLFAMPGTRVRWPHMLQEVDAALGEDYRRLLVQELYGGFDTAIACRALLDASTARGETPVAWPLGDEHYLAKLARVAIESKELTRPADNPLPVGVDGGAAHIDRWVEIGFDFLKAKHAEGFSEGMYIAYSDIVKSESVRQPPEPVETLLQSVDPLFRKGGVSPHELYARIVAKSKEITTHAEWIAMCRAALKHRRWLADRLDVSPLLAILLISGIPENSQIEKVLGQGSELQLQLVIGIESSAYVRDYVLCVAYSLSSEVRQLVARPAREELQSGGFSASALYASCLFWSRHHPYYCPEVRDAIGECLFPITYIQKHATVLFNHAGTRSAEHAKFLDFSFAICKMLGCISENDLLVNMGKEFWTFMNHQQMNVIGRDHWVYTVSDYRMDKFNQLCRKSLTFGSQDQGQGQSQIPSLAQAGAKPDNAAAGGAEAGGATGEGASASVASSRPVGGASASMAGSRPMGGVRHSGAVDFMQVAISGAGSAAGPAKADSWLLDVPKHWLHNCPQPELLKIIRHESKEFTSIYKLNQEFHKFVDHAKQYDPDLHHLDISPLYAIMLLSPTYHKNKSGVVYNSIVDNAKIRTSLRVHGAKSSFCCDYILYLMNPVRCSDTLNVLGNMAIDLILKSTNTTNFMHKSSLLWSLSNPNMIGNETHVHRLYEGAELECSDAIRIVTRYFITANQRSVRDEKGIDFSRLYRPLFRKQANIDHLLQVPLGHWAYVRRNLKLHEESIIKAEDRKAVDRLLDRFCGEQVNYEDQAPPFWLAPSDLDDIIRRINPMSGGAGGGAGGGGTTRVKSGTRAGGGASAGASAGASLGKRVTDQAGSGGGVNKSGSPQTLVSSQCAQAAGGMGLPVFSAAPAVFQADTTGVVAPVVSSVDSVRKTLLENKARIMKIANLAHSHVRKALDTKRVPDMQGPCFISVGDGNTTYKITAQHGGLMLSLMVMTQAHVEQIQNCCLAMGAELASILGRKNDILVENTWLNESGMDSATVSLDGLDAVTLFARVEKCLQDALGQLKFICDTVAAESFNIPHDGELNTPYLLTGVQSIATFSCSLLDNVGPKVGRPYMERLVLVLRELARKHAAAKPLEYEANKRPRLSSPDAPAGGAPGL